MSYRLRDRIFGNFAHSIRRIVNLPRIRAQELAIGKHVQIGNSVDIQCERLIIGDGVVISSGTKVRMKELVIGDYSKINDNSFFSGTDWCHIGHNCWFGHYSIVDSIGTTKIGNGVGVGGHSQLWTHAYFGDTLQGCRFASHQPLLIEDDVWFVGHCIISPIHARSRSMALVGSVVTKDMNENRVYAGVPAKDITDRVGNQFEIVSLDEQHSRMHGYLEEFLHQYRPKENRIEIVETVDPNRDGISQFGLLDRTYLKNLHPEEVQFMRFLLPWKAKFLPHPTTDWVASYQENRVS